ncbi:hypothetical protein PQX77_005351 [Marasmius sp. AFHP31]|nr:hypothetical protein PQX77_005351 [Marasmius sp. AFHP31]
MPNNPLRWRSRRQAGRLAKALGAGSGVTAVIGAVSGSYAAVGCGVTSGVLSIGAALLLQERSCDGDIESGSAGRGSEHNEEHIGLGAVTQANSSLQPSQGHANGIGEPEVHKTLSSRDGVHNTNETQSMEYNGLRQRPTHSTGTPSGNQSDQHDGHPSTISPSPQAAAPSPSIMANLDRRRGASRNRRLARGPSRVIGHIRKRSPSRPPKGSSEKSEKRSTSRRGRGREGNRETRSPSTAPGGSDNRRITAR